MPKKISTNPKAEAARDRKADSKDKASAEKSKAAQDREWAEAGEGSKNKAALKKEAEVRRFIWQSCARGCCSAALHEWLRPGGAPGGDGYARLLQAARRAGSGEQVGPVRAAQEKKRLELAAKKAEAKKLLEAEEAGLAAAAKKKTPAKLAGPKARAAGPPTPRRPTPASAARHGPGPAQSPVPRCGRRRGRAPAGPSGSRPGRPRLRHPPRLAAVCARACSEARARAAGGHEKPRRRGAARR